MIEIFNVSQITDRDDFEEILLQLKLIFYESSSLKDFSSPERKEAFFKRV